MGRLGRRQAGLTRVGEVLESRTLLTTVLINYSLDTNDFFDTQAKRDLLQSSIDSVADRLSDSLSSLEPGPSGLGFNNTWTAILTHPATGATHQITDMSVAADTLVVFVGGRSLSTAAIGGFGGNSSSGTTEWLSRVANRGQTGTLEFGPWGGSITFNTNTNWHFGETTTGLDNDESDFVSVVQHEFGHLLGIGIAPSWTSQVSGSNFTGTESQASFGGNVPLNPGRNHWAAGTQSNGQEASLTPSILDGTRKLLTPLDYAGLDDIGWSVTVPADTTPPTVTVNVVDANLSDADNSSSVTFEFSEAVSGFDSSDLTAIGGTLSNFQQIDADSYSATFTATASTEVTGSVSVGTGYVDAASNAGTAGSDTVAIDTKNPTVTVNIVDPSLNTSDTASVVTFEFSENVTAFTLDDISATGGNISALTGSGSSFSATFTATTGIVVGTVSVGTAYTDIAGNSGAGGSDSVPIFLTKTDHVLNGVGRFTDFVDVTSDNGNTNLDVELRRSNGTFVSTGNSAGRLSFAGLPADTYEIWVNDQIANYTVSPSANFGLGTGSPPVAAIDLDGGGAFSFSSDGILLLAFSLGSSGASLEAFRATGFTRSGVDIEAVILQLADSLDLDGDGQFRFGTDGIILLAKELGTSGTGLEAFRSSGAPLSGTEIETRIAGMSDRATGTRVQTPDSESVGVVTLPSPQQETTNVDTHVSPVVAAINRSSASGSFDQSLGAEDVASDSLGDNAVVVDAADDDSGLDLFYSLTEELGLLATAI